MTRGHFLRDADLMADVNPYQSPLPFDPLPEPSYPAAICPQCGACVAFWAGVKQPHPFRYKCNRCRARFKIIMPFKRTLFVFVSLYFAFLTLAMCAGVDYLGFASLRFSLPIMVVSLVILEAGWYQYIMRQGRFVLISGRKTEESTDACRSALN